VKASRHRDRRHSALKGAGVALAIVTCLSGCGFDVQSPDLFLLTRTGAGSKLTLLVNDAGTVRCNGGKAKSISNSILIQARDLSDDLAKDATEKLTIPVPAGAVFSYRIKLELGTVSFPDRASRGRKELAEAELFAAQTAQHVCGLGG
jgi:hypothetical protein